MSGRYPSQRGWDKPKTPSWVYGLVGVLLTLVVVLGIVIVMLLGSDPTGLASASATPTSPPTAATPTSVPSPAATSAAATPAPSQVPTPEVTTEPSPAVTPAVTSAPGATGSPAASTRPTLVSITLPHSADCARDYGYGAPGYIQISWATTGATGVRISIDPPVADGTAYAYGYKDEPASGSDWVPFTCGPTSHLYVVLTLHTTGYYQYRYQKVSQLPAPTPSPTP